MGLHLRRAACAWRLVLRDELAPFELTPNEFLVLDAVKRLGPGGPDGATQHMIGNDLSMDRTTVSRAMRSLDRRGLVDREGITFSAWGVLITPGGRELWEKAVPAVRRASARCFGRLAGDRAFVKRLRRVGASRKGDTQPRKH